VTRRALNRFDAEDIPAPPSFVPADN
jgi:hypothetical protein